MVIVRRIAHRRPPEVLLQQSSAVDAAANLGHAGARPLACRDPISLKNELGLDHFECRSYPGWNHHAVLAAITFTFIQLERRRRTDPLPTIPEIRNLVRELMATLFLLERPQWLNLALSFQRNPPLRI